MTPASQHVQTRTDGLLPGSVQVPGSGHPIVMLRDAQTTGGYPKIATVVSADIGRMAQRRLRSAVRFQDVSLNHAQLLRREFVNRLQALRLRVREV
jgi:allophanate hydrolase subunit 2